MLLSFSVTHFGLYGHGLGVVGSTLFALTLLPGAVPRLGCCAAPHCSVRERWSKCKWSLQPALEVWAQGHFILKIFPQFVSGWEKSVGQLGLAGTKQSVRVMFPWTVLLGPMDLSMQPASSARICCSLIVVGGHHLRQFLGDFWV